MIRVVDYDRHAALPLTVGQGELLSVATWYDNETGIPVGLRKLPPG